MPTVNVVLGATSSTATVEGGDAFYLLDPVPTSGSVTSRLPPVYAGVSSSVAITFQALGSSNQNLTVNSVTASADSAFNYTTSSNGATITQQNNPFSTSWQCLMEDYTTETFTSDTLALAADDPDFYALMSMGIPESVVIQKTHSFVVNITNESNVSENITVTVPESLYFEAQSYVSKIQAITAEGA